MNVCPAGLEDSEDEDDYMFGNEFNDYSNSNTTYTSYQPVSNPAVNRPAGGFGKPQEKAYNGKDSQWTKTAPRTPKFVKNMDFLPIDDYRNAIIRGIPEGIQEFIDEGVPVDSVLRAGWTGLMYAGQTALPKVVQLLLANGANPNFHKDHYTVLMAVCASTKDKIEQLHQCVDLLIGAGADVNAFDRFHMTALIYAAKEGRVKIIESLIENGANLDKQDHRGYTALMWAACNGHVRAVQVLLDRGADYNKQACDGSTAAEIAMVQGQTQVQTILKTYMGGDGEAPAIVERMVVEAENKAAQDAATSSDNITRYGDLELFLSGLECSNLIPTFQQHHMTFPEFLKMTDHDLIQLGIKELGVRKKILDAINNTHKKTWDMSSIQSFQYNKTLSCAEILAMVSNIGQHAMYISSTIYYIKSQIRDKPDILKTGNEESGVDSVYFKTEEAIANTEGLYREMVQLSNTLSKMSQREQCHPPDLIRPATKKRTWKVWRILGTIVILSTAGFVCWQGKPHVKLTS